MDLRGIEPADCQMYYRRKRRDHIVVEGDTLCHINVRLPRDDDSEDLKPLPEVTEREWDLIRETRSLCDLCLDEATSWDLLPETPPDRPPLPCPVCGEDAVKMMKVYGIGTAKHADGTKHDFDFEPIEEWRRKENPPSKHSAE